MSDFIDREDAVNAIYHHFPSMSKQDAEMVLYEVQGVRSDGDVISRQDTIKALKEEEYQCEDDRDEGFMRCLKKAIWIVEKWMPSAEPQERKTGHWILHDEGLYETLECSECGHMIDFTHKPKFCSECGAWMEVEHDT